MPWYVFALVDAAPNRGRSPGLQSSIVFRPAGGGFAAVERRADVPPVEFGTLRAHQEIVERLAARVPAILPVRFGTLLSADDIEDALDDRRQDLADAFALVRGRRQMTWRLRSSVRKPGKTDAPRTPDGTGAEYLRRLSRDTTISPSAPFRRVRDTAGRLAVAERHQPRTNALPETLYHLVDRTRLDAYCTSAAELRHGRQALMVSGPWAPYAFVPELF